MAVMEVADRAAHRRGISRTGAARAHAPGGPPPVAEQSSAASVMASRALLHAYHRQGDLEARQRLIQQYLPLVRRLARQHAGRGEHLEDLVQVGSIGLINAIDRFELDRGVDLAAYAIPSIVGEIKRHLRDRVGPIRIPRRLQEVNASLRASAAGLAATLERPATITEVARAAGVERDVALEALVALRSHEPSPVAGCERRGPGDRGQGVDRARVRERRGPCAAGEGLPRSRPAGTSAPPSRLLRRHEPGSHRAGGRHFADPRLAFDAPGAREAARRDRAGLATPKARLCRFLRRGVEFPG